MTEAKRIDIRVDLLADFKVLGHQCADTGKCHHNCKKKCAREESCVPLSIADWLNDDWTIKEKV
jgi:uncharacterized OB-fold protein